MSDDYWTQDITVRLLERANTARQEGNATAVGDAIHFEQAAAEISLLREEEDRLANKIEDLIAEFGENPTAALQCVSEWLELRRHAKSFPTPSATE